MNTSTLTISKNTNLAIDEHGISGANHMTQAEWEKSLKDLQRVKNSYHNILSDLIKYGHQRFGEQIVADTIDQLQFDLGDANKAIHIGNTSHSFRLKYNLSAEHYYVIGLLIKDEATKEKWAATSKKENLTALELKRSIEAGKVITKKEIEANSGHGSGIKTLQGATFAFERWKQQMGGSESINTLPHEELVKILENITPVIELAASIEEQLSQ